MMSAEITKGQGVTRPIGKVVTKEEETIDAHLDTMTETSTLAVQLVTTVVIVVMVTTEPMIDPLIADTIIQDAIMAQTLAENLGRSLIMVTQHSMLGVITRADADLKITAAIIKTAVAEAEIVVGAWNVEPAITTDHTHHTDTVKPASEFQTLSTINN